MTIENLNTAADHEEARIKAGSAGGGSNLNIYDAYRVLRQNDFKITVGSGRAESDNYTVTAYTKSNDLRNASGIVVRAEGETLEDALGSAARQVCRIASTLQHLAKTVGEDDFADFVYLS